MKWIFDCFVKPLVSYSFHGFTSHETFQWHLLALHQFGSGFKKLGAHMISISINLVLVHNSKVRMGEQNCHMPWPARHLMNRFCRPLLPLIWS